MDIAKLEHIDYRVLSLLTAEQAHAFGVIPLVQNGTSITIAGSEKVAPRLSELRMILGKKIELEPIEPALIQQYLSKYYPVEKGAKTSFLSNGQQEESDIVRFVNKILEEAALMKASDIHIERYEAEARIRYRWEGHLMEKYEVPIDQYNAIISRIKILAELDISERRLPQDGRIHMEVRNQSIDIRVSTIPGKYGEKAVLRLLTRSHEHLELTNLGMGDWEEKAYRASIRKPNGIILITGPTGSGKTTTLYATLNLLNQPEKNIVTIEDPIEYNLTGINQVQLKEEIGLGFDRALRAFLRQDPDIIMVGEIRDVATAKIAVRAALTGHLVFSTLHTNSSWDAITRMVDMGIEPYLLAASIRMIVAQRLVRVLCKACKEISEEVLFPEFQEAGNINRHSTPQGCPTCFYTGYTGRKAVFEVLPVGKELQSSIKDQAGEIGEYLKSHQIPDLSHNLIQLVQQGTTSLAEAVAHWEL